LLVSPRFSRKIFRGRIGEVSTTMFEKGFDVSRDSIDVQEDKILTDSSKVTIEILFLKVSRHVYPLDRSRRRLTVFELIIVSVKVGIPLVANLYKALGFNIVVAFFIRLLNVSIDDILSLRLTMCLFRPYLW
jgi:hypothetical protein